MKAAGQYCHPFRYHLRLSYTVYGNKPNAGRNEPEFRRPPIAGMFAIPFHHSIVPGIGRAG